MPALVDAHCHLDATYFPEGPDPVIGRAVDAGVVGFVVVGVGDTLEPARHAVALAARLPDRVCACVGIHPHDAVTWSDRAHEDLRELARKPEVVAVGEIGLDYHYDHSPRQTQRDVFARLIGLAREVRKPIVVHTREAAADTLALLESEGARDVGGIIHCFSEDRAFAQRALDLGFDLSLSGIVTFKGARSVQDVAAWAPLDRILVETDSPYLAPAPMRGKTCEPSLVWHTARRVAELRGMDLKDLAAATLANTERRFGRGFASQNERIRGPPPPPRRDARGGHGNRGASDSDRDAARCGDRSGARPAGVRRGRTVSRVATTSTKKVHGLTIALSLGLHAGLTAGFSWLTYRTLDRPAPPPQTSHTDEAALDGTGSIAVELPLAGEGVLLEERAIDPTGEPPRPEGGDTVAHLDRGSAGRGGETVVRAPALNLADVDERMRLSPDLVSRIDRDQLQRIRVARSRQSWEDRRSTTHPAELTLVVTGSGTVLERRVASRTMPSRGALESRAAGVRGGDLGFVSREPPSPDAAQPLGGAQLGSLDSAPGAGVTRALAGADHRSAAPVGSARPDVTRGPVAVPAPTPARPRDDVDSDQEVATTVQSLVHASSAGGLRGEGRGGEGGGGDSAAGGANGAGSRARPLGLGDGDVFDYFTNDPRVLLYFRQIHARLDPLWADAFPKSAIVELKQGTVILEFTIGADGHAVVSWPPLRPSGIEEFDRNCAEAVRRAAPFPPIPASLGVRSLTVRAPFVFNNPIVK